MANTNRSASKSGSGCLVLFALPFAAVGVGMGVWLCSTLLAYFSARNWVETPAHIIRTELKAQRGKSTTYETTAEYSYEYGGQKYTGTRVGLNSGADNVGSFQQTAFRELSRYQNSKQPFRCYVNPAQPDQSLLYRDLRWELVAFKMLFVLVFGGVGFGMLIGGLAAHGKQRVEAALGTAHAESPWMWKADWAAGRIVTSSKTAVLAVLVFAVFWNLVSSPLWFILPGEILDKGNNVALLGLLFPAVGLLLIGWAVLSILRWRKFGQSVFQMASVPGVIGGQLAGVIQTSAKIRPEDGFHLLLRCIRRITTGSGKSRSTSETVLWEDERIAMHELLDDQAEQSAIPVVFQIPYDCHPSDEQNLDNQTLWRLTAAAEVPGIDYVVTFDVPIFKTPQSDPHFVPERGTMSEYVGVPTPERELREAGVAKTTAPDGEGVRFVFPMARNPSSTVFFTIFWLIWTGAIVVIFHLDGPLVPMVIGLLVDIPITWALIDFWFYRSVVDISDRELAVSGGLLGLGATRQIELANVKAIETRQGMSFNENVYYHVVAVCSNGKRITLGKRLPSLRLAAAVARQMEEALGRQPAAAKGT